MGQAWTWRVVAAALVSASLASAQEPADTNQIVGRIEFTNSNPEILAVLDEPGLKGLEHVSTWVIPEPGSFPATTQVEAEQRTWAEYEMTVEAGVPGVTHLVAARSSLRGPPFGTYRFLPRESPPVEPDPAPDAVLDFSECVGLIRLRFVDASGSASEILSARAWARGELTSFSADSGHDQTEMHLPVRGDGTPFDLSVEITLEVAGSSDLVRISRQLVMGVGCDEIQDWEITLPPLDDLASVVGRFDLLGVEELADSSDSWEPSTRVLAWGPISNSRWHLFTEPPASGDFELPNLLPSSHFEEPSTYRVEAHAAFHAGPSYQQLSTTWVEQSLAANETVDLGELFVMTPSWLDGEVVLRAPVSDPVDSPFLDLVTSLEDDFLPLIVRRASFVRVEGSNEVLPGASRSARSAVTEGWLDGYYGPGARSWEGAFSLAVAQPGDEPGRFREERIELTWEDRETPERPETYIDETLRLHFGEEEHDLWPGDRQALRHELCLSELRMTLRGEEGAVFSPWVTLEGSFEGVDLSGQPNSYEAYVTGRGTPSWEGDADDEGLVTLFVPEGDYRAWTSVLVTGDDGRWASTTTWSEEELSVSCGQVLELRPELRVSLNSALPDCVGSSSLEISGTVDSEIEVARLAWSVNGSAETVLCEPCGPAPSFAFDAPLVERDNWIRVRAVDAEGREAAVQAVTRHAPEPSSLDRDPAAEPLRVTRSEPTGLRLTWERPAHDRFNVYQGRLDTLWETGAHDHQRLGVCQREDAELVFRARVGNLYWLVSSSCGEGEGSYGRDSNGAERPLGAFACP